jgi:hypothetical protein
LKTGAKWEPYDKTLFEAVHREFLNAFRTKNVLNSLKDTTTSLDVEFSLRPIDERAVFPFLAEFTQIRHMRISRTKLSS